MIRASAASRKLRPILRVPAGEPPAILSVSPSSGTAAGGTTITITLDSYVGSYDVIGVTVNDVAATDVTIVDGNTVTAVTPEGSAGALVVVKVSNPWGTGRKNGAYTFTALGDVLLQEIGDDILLETGDRLLKE